MAEPANDQARNVVGTVRTGTYFDVRFLDLEGKVRYSAVRVYVNHSEGMKWLNSLYADLEPETVVQWDMRPIQVVV